MREALGVETRSFGTDPSEAETVYARRVRNLSDRPSPTVGAMYRGWLGGQPWAQLPDGQRRILTVEECALLQGFPAGHPWQGQSRPQYRQVGNAVPPRLAEVVGRALMTAIEDVRGLS
jgi:DNA (cytosine-5)-methyltransferase 1